MQINEMKSRVEFPELQRKEQGLQSLTLAGAARFLKASPESKRKMLVNLRIQVQEERASKKWERLNSKGVKFAESQHDEKYLLRVTRDDISSQLFIHGSHEYGKVQVALSLLGWSKVRTFVDVGANVGHVVIPGLIRETFAEGIAIEAEPVNFGLLVINGELNDLSARLKYVHAAAGDGTANRLTLAVSDDEFGDHRVAQFEGSLDDRKRITVPTCTIDAIAPDLERESDLLWMDIQGYEGFALRGAEIARSRRVPMVLELWPDGLSESGETAESMLNLLSGYQRFANLYEPEVGWSPISELADLWISLSGRANGRSYVDVLLA